MLQNAYLLARIGADTAENEQHFAENLPLSSSRASSSGDALHEGPAGKDLQGLLQALDLLLAASDTLVIAHLSLFQN